MMKESSPVQESVYALAESPEKEPVQAPSAETESVTSYQSSSGVSAVTYATDQIGITVWVNSRLLELE